MTYLNLASCINQRPLLPLYLLRRQQKGGIVVKPFCSRQESTLITPYWLLTISEKKGTSHFELAWQLEATCKLMQITSEDYGWLTWMWWVTRKMKKEKKNIINNSEDFLNEIVYDAVCPQPSSIIYSLSAYSLLKQFKHFLLPFDAYINR